MNHYHEDKTVGCFSVDQTLQQYKGLSHLLRIWEVSSLNLGPRTLYPY